MEVIRSIKESYFSSSGKFAVHPVAIGQLGGSTQLGSRVNWKIHYYKFTKIECN